ncbi:MAG: glycosyltransferase [bacterium]|nr:glycosyltransferase [bacterium]
MKILHIIIGLNVGGAELMLKRLIESHRKNSGYEHSVVSLTDLGKIGPLLQESGIEVTMLGMRSGLDAPVILYRLVNIIRIKKPDIVQTWMYHADLLGGLAARLCGCRSIIWGIRTTDVSAGGSKVTIVIRKLCALLSRVVPSVIICAAEASRRSHVAIGYDEERMIVIPNGFDPAVLVATDEQRAAIRLQHGIAPDELVVGSVGRFNPDKDHGSFIRAAGLLAARFSPVKFMLVGRDLDAGNRPLMDLVAASGCPERFILVGERQDIPACLKAMDIFCLHSRTEGFPNVLGEAMTMGLPCVATDVGDAGYLLDEAGILVPPLNLLALAGGLEKMIMLSKTERAELGQKAQDRIHSFFTMQRTSERFAQVYDGLFSGKGAV